MAKIVGYDSSFAKRITCRECTAIVEYAHNEVHTVNGTDYSGGSDGYEWVSCPSCNGRAIIRSW